MYPSILIEHLHHHSWGLIPQPTWVPMELHPMEEQRLIPNRVQGAGQHAGALADVHEGDVGNGVCGSSAHCQHPKVLLEGVRVLGGGPTCCGLGAVGLQLQCLEEVTAQLEGAGS